MEGKINIDEVEKRIDKYYKVLDNRKKMKRKIVKKLIK